MLRTENRTARQLLGWLLASGLLAPGAAWSCPFCNATSQTLSEEVRAADAALLVQRVLPPAAADDDAAADDAAAGDAGGVELKKTRFRVVKVIRGADLVQSIKEIDVIYFGQAEPSTTFLVTGLGAPSLDWTTPLPLTGQAVGYVEHLLQLPAEGPERLVFFQEYLEHADPLLAQDAYDEFARAPYAEVVDLKEKMQHERLVVWVQDLEISPSRRRLYLTMLGACGDADDAAMLEKMIRSDDRKVKMGLDAMIASYLVLAGPDGLPLVEDLFLKNRAAAYQDTYAAVMALRFHGQELAVIPRPRILQAMRHLLDHPDLADQIIPDLARWQDWSVMDRMVELFKVPGDNSRWVRIPVINYLRECAKQPGDVGQRARTAIAELTEIDPESVRRANTFFAFGALAGAKADAVKNAAPTAVKASAVAEPAAAAEPAPAGSPPTGGGRPGATDLTAGAVDGAAREEDRRPAAAGTAAEAAATGTQPAAEVRDLVTGQIPAVSSIAATGLDPSGDEFTTVEEFTEVPRLLLIVGTLVAALVLLALLWMILARPNQSQGAN